MELPKGPPAVITAIKSKLLSAPITVTTTTLVAEAIRVLRDHKIDEVPVLDDRGRPAGILDVQDILEIRTGAEDGSEMGAFGFLKQPQREAGLRRRLQEHVPFGMDIGLFCVT